jgi:hypothetical protein
LNGPGDSETIGAAKRTDGPRFLFPSSVVKSPLNGGGRVEGMPGVEALGVTRSLPFDPNPDYAPITIEGRPPTKDRYQGWAKYLCDTKDGKSFRNVEYLRIKNGKLESIECYFGAQSSLPSAVSTGQIAACKKYFHTDKPLALRSELNRFVDKDCGLPGRVVIPTSRNGCEQRSS